jgi:hypothetical protein
MIDKPSIPLNPDDPNDFTPLTPELVAWAKDTFDLEEFLEGMRDIEQNGGYELKDFIDELKKKSLASE